MKTATIHINSAQKATKKIFQNFKIRITTDANPEYRILVNRIILSEFFNHAIMRRFEYPNNYRRKYRISNSRESKYSIRIIQLRYYAQICHKNYIYYIDSLKIICNKLKISKIS